MIRNDRTQRPLCEGTVPNLTTSGTTHEAGLAHTERRKLVVVHEPLGRFPTDPVNALFVPARAQGEQRQYLSLPTGEQPRAVRPRRDTRIHGYWPYLILCPPIGAHLVHCYAASYDLLLYSIKGFCNIGCLLSCLRQILSRAEGRDYLFLDATDRFRALLLLKLGYSSQYLLGKTSLDLVYQERVRSPGRKFHLRYPYFSHPFFDCGYLLLDCFMRHLKSSNYFFFRNFEASRFNHAYGFSRTRHYDIDRTCLLYTSDAADDLLCVDLGGRRIIKKKKKKTKK